jgi:DNA repair photolyase
MANNMYKDVDQRWNPLAGKCIHNCSYCYVNNWKHRSQKHMDKYNGEPTIWKNPFKAKFKGRVFVCSMNDLFAENVPEEVIIKIIKYCSKFPDAEFLFQTKNTPRLEQFVRHANDVPFPIFQFPENSIFCTTIETNRIYPNIMKNTISPWSRIKGIKNLLNVHITIEPILDFDCEELVEMIQVAKPLQVNIGADSKKNNLPEPSKEKVIALINILKTMTNVVIKDNLHRIIK